MSPTPPVWNCPRFDHESLIREYGSPLFLFFPTVLEANLQALSAALCGAYPKHVIAYSVKTNDLPYAVRRAVSFGAVPEVISGFELDLAERLGFLDARTVVNGPLKTDEELERIVRAGCRLNVDNVTELEVLNRIGDRLNRSIEIGLRITSETGDRPWGRFGFRANTVPDVARTIASSLPRLTVVGLHMHSGTNVLDVEQYRRTTARLCQLAQHLSSERLADIAYLDVGGGFATACPFKDSAAWEVPSIGDYVDAIVGPVRCFFGDDGPILIVEPGRYLVDDAFVLLTRVERFRESGGGEIVVDAGVNVMPSARFRRHQLLCLSQNTGEPTQYTIWGPLCMPSDCLASDVTLPRLNPGDVLAIDHAGAYSLSQAWTFIRLQPAVVAVEDGTATLVRRAQTIDDVLARDLGER